MSLQLLTILSPTTPCIPILLLTALSRDRSRNGRSPFPGRVPFLASPLRCRLANASGRIEFIFVFVYGLVIRFRLLSTPSLDDAVAFSYGQTSASVRLGLSPNCWCALSGALLDRVPRSCSHGPLSLGYKAIASLLRFRPKILQTFFRRAGPLWDRARLRAQDLHISANARRS